MNELLLLSIKTKHANKIFNGTKVYEFRKKSIGSKNINKKVFIYSSEKDKKIIGYIIIDKILEGNIDYILKETNNVDNESLKEDNLSMQDELNDFRQRAELYDKYDYAIIREEDGSRTDITYDNIKSLEELSAEQRLTEDANQLILSIAMTESRGYETAENSQSTATGFGQFLSGTGRFVYTSLMDGDGVYKHSEMAKDGQTNLDMMVYYISYLDEKYHGNLSSIIDEYRGTHDSTYLTKLDKYLGKKDLSTSTIQLSKR